MNSTTFNNDIAVARYIARTKPDLKLYGENVLQSTEVRLSFRSTSMLMHDIIHALVIIANLLFRNIIRKIL